MKRVAMASVEDSIAEIRIPSHQRRCEDRWHRRLPPSPPRACRMGCGRSPQCRRRQRSRRRRRASTSPASRWQRVPPCCSRPPLCPRCRRRGMTTPRSRRSSRGTATRSTRHCHPQRPLLPPPPPRHGDDPPPLSWRSSTSTTTMRRRRMIPTEPRPPEATTRSSPEEAPHAPACNHHALAHSVRNF